MLRKLLLADSAIWAFLTLFTIAFVFARPGWVLLLSYAVGILGVMTIIHGAIDLAKPNRRIQGLVAMSLTLPGLIYYFWYWSSRPFP